jgi:primosomal protein N' (replication factor Y) (superfamily II helicase)
MFANVAVPLPIYQTFAYLVPATMRGNLRPGCRVLVPFGSRPLIGVTVGMRTEVPTGEVKAIQEVLDDEPIFSPEMVELALWIASYYLAPPGKVMQVMLPPGLLRRKVRPDQGSPSERFWPTKQQRAVVKVTVPAVKLTERQKEAWQLLKDATLPVLVQPFIRETGCSDSVLKSLASKGAIRIESIEMQRSPWSRQGFRLETKKHALTADQRKILKTVEGHLCSGQFSSVLLHGVTGSGKTEIYLNAISTALAQGKSALVLVPEIGLTPQTSQHFRAWFGKEVAILHSGLSEGERFDQWRKIRKGRARVVVGTRSAVFAPFRELGIIFVDEEQDGSYKQEKLPRYHARDVALKRGQIEKAVVVLGSATPQLETYYRAVQGERLQYETLSSRVLERPLPSVKIVDMRAEFQRHGKAAVISEPLRQAIGDRLERKEQILVLLNRRGYSSALLCRSCGNVEVCEDCSISLTYHRGWNRLICHYCGGSSSIPQRCDKCDRKYLFLFGEGTEKIQEILSRLFPQAAIDRLDRDTVRRRGAIEKILGTFASGRTDILIGTQMIAKGHDFPKVTLVGVLAAERALRMPDFRAAEKTFQLLTQVAGRAGRGERPGEVIIQTYHPNHYSLRCARTQDYRLFFEEEIRFRRRFKYPPFTALANLLIRGKEQEKVGQLAAQVADLLLFHRRHFSAERRMRILGPAPAALEKLKGLYRFQIVIKTTSREELHQVLGHTLEDLAEQRVDLQKIAVDVDPLNLL